METLSKVETVDQEAIKTCPVCKDASGAPFVYYYNQVTCPTCQMQGPRGDNAAAGIRAWNQMALAFEIARAWSLLISVDEARYQIDYSGQEEKTLLSIAEDADNILYGDATVCSEHLAGLLAEWRHTDG